MISAKLNKNLRGLFLAVACIFPASTMAANIFWEESFTSGVATGVGAPQEVSWVAFKNQLLPNLAYVSMTISGSQDPTGITCTDPQAVAQFANLLNTGADGEVSCNGRNWTVCGNRYSGEVWIDPPNVCSGFNCPDPGYIIRPGIGNPNWGGINGPTCDSNASQTMRLEFVTDENAQPALQPQEIPALSSWSVLLMVLLLGLIPFWVRGRAH